MEHKPAFFINGSDEVVGPRSGARLRMCSFAGYAADEAGVDTIDHRSDAVIWVSGFTPIRQ